jgi:hypothetical protein
MAAKTTLGKMKSSFQEMLEFSRRELKGGTGDIKGELITFAKRTTTLMKGQSQPPAEAIPSIVNPEVGGLILLHFLIVHSRLRDDITKSAHKASEADVTLQTLSKRTSSWYRLIEECDVEFRCVPDLIKSVLKAKAKVSDIHNELNRIHQSLYELEILNAKLDNERKKNSVLLQLKMHKMDKEKENKQLEGRIVVKEREITELKVTMEQRNRAERQETFQEMFAEDCNEFMSTGKLDRQSSLTSSTKSLEEVEFDDEEGKRSLDEFLEDVPLSPVPGERGDESADELDSAQRGSESGTSEQDLVVSKDRTSEPEVAQETIE